MTPEVAPGWQPIRLPTTAAAEVAQSLASGSQSLDPYVLWHAATHPNPDSLVPIALEFVEDSGWEDDPLLRRLVPAIYRGRRFGTARVPVAGELLALLGSAYNGKIRRIRLGRAWQSPQLYAWPESDALREPQRLLNHAMNGRSTKNFRDEVELIRLDPQYRILFGGGGHIDATADIPEMERQISRISPADAPGFARSNLGMYRVQLSGGQYAPDRQIGLHYQIHRGIGVHHSQAVKRGEKLRVNVIVGGPPVLPATRGSFSCSLRVFPLRSPGGTVCKNCQTEMG